MSVESGDNVKRQIGDMVINTLKANTTALHHISESIDTLIKCDQDLLEMISIQRKRIDLLNQRCETHYYWLVLVTGLIFFDVLVHILF